MTAWQEDLCPGPMCSHPACFEQQRLVEENTRLKADLEKAVDELNGYLLAQDRAAEDHLLRGAA